MNVKEQAAGMHRTELVIGNLLRAGVLTAAAVVTAGGAVYLFRHGLEAADYAVFSRQPEKYSSVAGIITEAFSGGGRGMVQLGLLILIATPPARVAFSVYAFARQKDRLYVAVTLLVLAVLAYSLLGR
jgi:uncharacterized membrane protein